MRLAEDQRYNMLKRLGFARDDIQWGIKQANIVRNKRKSRNELVQFDKLYERVEFAQRQLFACWCTQNLVRHCAGTRCTTL